ncbi:MAG: FAD-dependent thymidylate synthase [bacterium]|nr:FAD-dependent thymidylate synthase [bacterium]
MYVAETFTAAEADILRRYFTNLDQPVFALVNLPEVVKGALFARYSRSAKSLRRLFLDEFVGELDVSGDLGVDATIGLRRAEELYDRVFFEYGDDSVAQLGGVHLACEQASNVLTKVLEWGRLMSYLEQSTRYVAYDARLGGRYRYYRDPDILGSSLGARYIADLDAMFESYSSTLPVMNEHFRRRFPIAPGDSDFVHRQAIRAKSFDSVRGMLPAAALSNVGIYGSGQGYENLLLRMRAHALPEVRAYADMMLVELRKVIPSFLKRLDVEDRGVAWSRYLRATGASMQALAHELFSDAEKPYEEVPAVRLVDFDPDAEVKLVSSALYSHVDVPEEQLRARVEDMSAEDRLRVLLAYTGDRRNRRHKPGRALETPSYRFDVLCDYGAFRDLQRHRMLTIEWQRLSPGHGYSMPEAVAAAGLEGLFTETMARSAELHDTLLEHFPEQAAYAVALAYRIRFVMQMNAREAMHLIELRSSTQGHPAYRHVAQEMHRLIETTAGHRAIAGMMSFADRSREPELERLASERRAATRRRDAV